MKRIICVFSALFLMLWPIPVFADYTEPEILDEYTGQIGENVTWTLKDRVLTLSGTGKTYDFESDTDTPFNTWTYSSDDILPWQIKDSIKEIRIGEGITEIGSYLFTSCTASEVTLPSTLERIGQYAFGLMENLQEIELPDSLETLGNFAFVSSGLEKINIPPLIHELPEECLGGCHFTSIEIPETVTKLGPACLFHNPLREITIPSSVTELPKSLFESCNNLEEVTLPDTLTFIGRHCFIWCNSLKSITIPDSCSMIEEGAFYDCPILKEVHLPASLTDLPDECFRKCVLLDNVDIPDSVTKIGHNCFQDCTSLKTVRLPENSELEIDPAAFPDSWFAYQDDYIIIGDHTLFRYNGDETEVTLPDDIKTIQQNAFYKSNVEKVTIGAGTETVGARAFHYCERLRSVTAPDTVRSLEFAFFHCDALQSLSGPHYSAAHYYAAAHQLEFIPTDTVPEIQNCKADHTAETLSFGNGGGVFGKEYSLTPWADACLYDHGETMPLWKKTLYLRKSAWGGSCFGLSALTVLVQAGIISLSDLDADAECLHDIQPTEDIISVINYYHVLQNIEGEKEIESGMPAQTTMVGRIQKLAADYNAGGEPFVLNYGSSGSGHAVVGFGLEAGDWEWNGDHFNRRVHVWDSNYTQQSDRTQFYFNSETLHYAIPAYASYYDGQTASGRMQLLHPVTAKDIRSYSGNFFDTKPQPGDADLSGTVSAADAVYLARFVCEQDNAPMTHRGAYNADADRDGILSFRDAVSILKMI